MKKKGIDGIAKRGKTRTAKPKQSKPAKAYMGGGRVNAQFMDVPKGGGRKLPADFRGQQVTGKAAVDALNSRLNTIRPGRVATSAPAAPPDVPRRSATADAARAKARASRRQNRQAARGRSMSRRRDG